MLRTPDSGHFGSSLGFTNGRVNSFVLASPFRGGPVGAPGLAIMSPVPETPRRVDRLPLTPRLDYLTRASPVTSSWAIAWRRVRTRSVLHVAGIFDTALQLRASIPASVMDTLTEHEVGRMYALCDSECDRQASSSVTRRNPMPQLLPDPLTKPKPTWERSSVSRKIVPAQLQGSLLQRGAAADAKVAALVISMWALFVDLGSSGTLWDSYASLHGDLRTHHESMTKESWSDIPKSSLRGTLSILSRWKSWAVQRRVPWRSPQPTHIALWLRTLRSRGPTAARGAFNSLRWAETHLGFRAHTACVQVKGQSAIGAAHKEKQATPLPIRIWMFFEHAASSTNDFVALLALIWLLLIAGAVRFAHVQRSRIESLGERMLVGCASRGKRRFQGKRRPFQWSVPRFGLGGIDFGKRLQAAIERAAAGQDIPAFLLFDFAPARSTLENVTSFAPCAMSYARFLKFTRSLLASEPLRLSAADCRSITTYSARRLLPSLADSAGLSITDRLAIGGWTDPAPDGQSSNLDTQARRMAMPSRYSDQRLAVASRAKESLLRGVATSYKAFRKQFPSSENPEWDAILRFWPSRTAPGPSEQDTAIKTSRDISWVCSRSASGRLHAAARAAPAARLSLPGSSSDPPPPIRTRCGRALSDPIVGSGDCPRGRLWCQICGMHISELATEASVTATF